MMIIVKVFNFILKWLVAWHIVKDIGQRSDERVSV